MSNPVFAVNDIVYLVSSAKVGSIESYEVSGVRQDPTGAWYYQISVPQRPPNSNATFGDRINLRRSFDFELAESELCIYCEAIDFAVDVATETLANLTALQTAHCQDEVTGGTA